MALVLNDEQRMLQDSARVFISESAPVAHLRALRDGRDDTGFSRDLWKKFAEMGFSGILVPEGQGGSGLGVVEAGVIAEELGRTLAPSPFLSTAVLAAAAIRRGGSAAQQAAMLPKIAAAELVVALAIDEGVKHRPGAIATKAVRDGAGYRIDGAKTLVVDGHVADRLIVAARVAADGDPVALFVVDARAPGVAIERTVMVDAHNAARVRLTNVQVGADALLGSVEGGAALLEAVLDTGRAVLASELLGIADEVFARTLTYLKERRQFGRIIGEFQALQHRASELFCDIEMTRAIVIRALQAVDEDPVKARDIVSAAKARACTTANRAVQEGVQMHGGMGMTDQFDIGLFMKRARVAQELLGDAHFHADRHATLNAY
ncbi:MAG TPA: acyl-CoA dehydrogenase family protein [Quisquiliibacterium sp.]|nr:acyl-CoA dehydrogenase family protein [Quisquiliibacterium sp.]